MTNVLSNPSTKPLVNYRQNYTFESAGFSFHLKTEFGNSESKILSKYNGLSFTINHKSIDNNNKFVIISVPETIDKATD